MVFRRLRHFRLRRPIGMAIASAALLVLLAVLWLSVSTRTAILSTRLDELDARWRAVEWENTELERTIGSLTSVQVMEQRMRIAGYGPAERTLYLTSTHWLSDSVPAGTSQLPLADPNATRAEGEP